MNNQAAQTMHPDALPDGTLSKSTAKRVEALASASVSERARVSKQVHDMLIDLRAAASIGRPITGDELHELEQDILRALEQALTQQRGECWPLNKNPKDGWTFDPSFLDEVKTRAEQSDIGEFAPCLEGVESVLIALRGMGDTTPQPSADAVREVPDGMVLAPRELLWRVLDSVDVKAMADASDELRSILEAQ